MFLQINNLEKFYGEKDNRVQVLKGLSTGIEKGEICVLLGPSGSGKSTMLRCATMLETIDDGEIIYLGDKAAFSKDGHAVYAKAADLKKIHSYYGLVFQNFNLIEELTVFENIELPLVAVARRPVTPFISVHSQVQLSTNS